MWLLSSRQNLILRVGTKLTDEAVTVCDMSLSHQLAADVAVCTYRFRASLLLIKGHTRHLLVTLLVEEQQAETIEATTLIMLV